MNAMLLAAGRSTRLGALGERLPKPLVPICGYPAIRFGCAALERAGFREVVVNLHHHARALRAALRDGQGSGLAVVYSDEPELLGTGGGLARAAALLGDGPVLVMNAKVVADVDLRAVVAAHQASGAEATLVLRDDPDAARWGAIAADAEGRITSILGRSGPRAPHGPVTERMFTGIQVVGSGVRARLRPIFSDTVRDGYIPALLEGAHLHAFVATGYFAEHSTPQRYLQGNLALLGNPSLIPHPPGPLVGVDPGARLEPGAHLIPPLRIGASAVVQSGAIVGPDVVLGDDTRVLPGVHLTRTVVWPGVTATESHTGSVLTPDGPVKVDPAP
jgi:NDP-sugar pyrophosphorylase family protein